MRAFFFDALRRDVPRMLRSARIAPLRDPDGALLIRDPSETEDCGSRLSGAS
jgi:hypothetical protein